VRLNTLPWAAKQFDTDDGLARPTGGGGLEAEAGNPALTPKALALLRVIRGYERRVRQLALKSDYRVARTLPR
jgi:hypothetical protein